MVIAGTVQGGAIRAKYVTIVRSFARSIEGELKGGPNRKAFDFNFETSRRVRMIKRPEEVWYNCWNDPATSNS